MHDDTERPDDKDDYWMLKQQAKKALEGLGERECEIVEMLLGMKDDHPRTHEEVARELGISLQEVLEAKGKLYMRMHRPCVHVPLKEYLDD